jgi:hypothetical protein
MLEPIWNFLWDFRRRSRGGAIFFSPLRHLPRYTTSCEGNIQVQVCYDTSGLKGRVIFLDRPFGSLFFGFALFYLDFIFWSQRSRWIRNEG